MLLLLYCRPQYHLFWGVFFMLVRLRTDKKIENTSKAVWIIMVRLMKKMRNPDYAP